MFALRRPLPHCSGLTSWRLWNNLKLASTDVADTSLLYLVFESKIQEVNGSMILVFCMQNFSFLSFSHRSNLRVLLALNAVYVPQIHIQSRFVPLPKRLYPVSESGVHSYMGPFSNWNQSSSALRLFLLSFGSQTDIWILLGVWSMSKTDLPCSIPFGIWGFFPALPGTSLPFPLFHWIFFFHFFIFVPQSSVTGTITALGNHLQVKQSVTKSLQDPVIQYVFIAVTSSETGCEMPWFVSV